MIKNRWIKSKKQKRTPLGYGVRGLFILFSCTCLVACESVLPTLTAQPPVKAPAIQEGPHQLNFKAPLNKQHPLVGKFWSPASQTFVTWEEVVAHFPRNGWLLIGEPQEHPDSAQIEDFFLRYLAARGALGHVLMPMFTVDQEKLLKQLTTQKQIPTAEALYWNESLWSWSAYQQQIKTAVIWSEGVKAGDLSVLQKDLLQAAALGVAHFSVEHTKYLARQMHQEACAATKQTITNEAQAVTLHLARDQLMAQQLLAYAKPNKVGVMIAPNTHVRNDIGTPIWVADEINLRTIMLVPVTGSEDPNYYFLNTFEQQNAAQLLFFVPQASESKHCT